MRAHQPPLGFAAMAYVLLCALRRIGLARTQFAEATCGTLRLALPRIGAQVRRSARRIKLAMASAYPYRDEFALAHAGLAAAAARRRPGHRKPPSAPTTPRHERRWRHLAILSPEPSPSTSLDRTCRPAPQNQRRRM